MLNHSIKELNCDLNAFVFQIVLFKYIRKSLTYRCKDIEKQKRLHSAREVTFLNCICPYTKNEYIDFIPADAYGNETTIVEYISKDLNEFISDEKLNRVIKKLTDKQQFIIRRIMVDEESEKNIALELDITVQGVNKLKNSALNNIRKELGVAEQKNIK